jgi:hypothetical protein
LAGRPRPRHEHILTQYGLAAAAITSITSLTQFFYFVHVVQSRPSVRSANHFGLAIACHLGGFRFILSTWPDPAIRPYPPPRNALFGAGITPLPPLLIRAPTLTSTAAAAAAAAAVQLLLLLLALVAAAAELLLARLVQGTAGTAGGTILCRWGGGDGQTLDSSKVSASPAGTTI